MGILELLVIAVVGLLVVGPEKLPDTIKVCVVWFSRIKRMLNSTRAEIEQQIGMDEIRRELHNEQVMESLKSMNLEQDSIQETARSASQLVADVNKRLEEEKLEELYIGEQKGNHPEPSNSISPAEPAPPPDDSTSKQP